LDSFLGRPLPGSLLRPPTPHAMDPVLCYPPVPPSFPLAGSWRLNFTSKSDPQHNGFPKTTSPKLSSTNLAWPCATSVSSSPNPPKTFTFPAPTSESRSSSILLCVRPRRDPPYLYPFPPFIGHLTQSDSFQPGHSSPHFPPLHFFLHPHPELHQLFFREVELALLPLISVNLSSFPQNTGDTIIPSLGSSPCFPIFFSVAFLLLVGPSHLLMQHPPPFRQ